MAEIQYHKAADHIDVILYPTEWLRLNLERVALLEHQLGSVRNKGTGAKKIFEAIFELLLNSKQAFAAYSAKNSGKTRKRTQDGDKYCDESENTLTDKRELHEVSDKTKPTFITQKPFEEETGENILQKETPLCDDTRKHGDNSGKWRTNSSEEEFHRFGGKNETENTMPGNAESHEFLNLLDIFEARLKNCLSECLKMSSTSKTSPNTQQKERESVLKRMFELTLRASLARKSKEIGTAEQCKKVLETISALEKLQTGTSLKS